MIIELVIILVNYIKLNEIKYFYIFFLLFFFIFFNYFYILDLDDFINEFLMLTNTAVDKYNEDVTRKLELMMIKK